MNSIERMNAVLDRQKPDRAPVGFHNFLQAAYLSKTPDLGAWLHDGEAMAEAHLAIWKEVRHDMIQLENSTCALAEAVGCDVKWDPILPPHVQRTRLTDYSQLSEMKVPDPFTTEPLKSLIKAAKILMKEIGKEAYIQARADQGPMALAISIFPYEQFLMDCVDPDMEKEVDALLDYCTQCSLRLIEAFASIGAPATSIGGMGTSLCSPPTWRRWESPYQRKYVDGCRKAGIRSFTHTCGSELKIIPDIIATGCDALELDPRSDPKAVAGMLKGKSTVLGMLDPVTVLKEGTPELVKEKSRELFEIYHPEVPFIIGAGCALPPDAPIENCIAVVEAAKEFGRF